MEREKQNAREWYDLLGTFVCVTVAAVLVFTFLLRIERVDGPSMRETLQDGDVLLAVNRSLAGNLRAGDIVIVRKEHFEDGKPIVKRVIATQGQTVDIDFGEGTVYVDGTALEEDYTREPTWLDEGLAFPVTVPENCVFLLGDNRNNSKDSRYPDLGPVDVRSIIGKAVILAFPGKTEQTQRRELARIGLL